MLHFSVETSTWMKIRNMIAHEPVVNSPEKTGLWITTEDSLFSPTDTDLNTSGAKFSYQHLHCCLLDCEWRGRHWLLPGVLYGGASSQQRWGRCVRSCLHDSSSPFSSDLMSAQGRLSYREGAGRSGEILHWTGNSRGEQEVDILYLLIHPPKYNINTIICKVQDSCLLRSSNDLI